LVGLRVLFLLVAVSMVTACRPAPSDRVDASDYDSFWLWAGVDPQPVLTRAKSLYLLDGEVVGSPPRYVTLRPEPPRLAGKPLWLVVRVEDLHWPDGAYAAVGRRLRTWERAGNRVVGVQIDFDARTRHLNEYARFLADFRRRLSPPLKLSITGLLDWSANGDPAALHQLKPIVDEVVLQTYQARRTVPGYEAYLAKLGDFRLPFRIGLVQGGEWRDPASLRANPRFKGYVVFLLNPPGTADRGRPQRH
jgi:hypothetical protein